MRKKELTTEPLRILFEGDPGAGKTRLADSSNSSPETSPALHLDLRGNTITLGVVPGDHYVIDVETIDDLRNIYNWLAQGQPQTTQPVGVDRAAAEGEAPLHPIAEMFPGVVLIRTPLERERERREAEEQKNEKMLQTAGEDFESRTTVGEQQASQTDGRGPTRFRRADFGLDYEGTRGQVVKQWRPGQGIIKQRR